MSIELVLFGQSKASTHYPLLSYKGDIAQFTSRKAQAMGLSGPKRHTDKTGDISEAAIITRLLQSGYVVLTPTARTTAMIY